MLRAKRTEMMLDGLKMNKAEIVLYEIVKSKRELKDCFRFSYEGRDYKCLSMSEKIKAGLEVSQLVQRLSGRNYIKIMTPELHLSKGKMIFLLFCCVFTFCS